jgi:nitrite reductase/ring-hydroxylating ferredoxin subunit
MAMTLPTVPAIPQSWYLVCRARALRPGQAIAWTLGTHPLVVYRTATGRVVAMDARCPHMGAHLARGRVVGEDLQCALHHWSCTPAGESRPPAGGVRLSQRVYATAERYGSIFVFAGSEPRFDIPRITDDERQTPRVFTAPAVTIKTTWPALVSNAFDIEHMDAVHHRVLREPPALHLLGGEAIELTYVSRVTGGSAADRITRWIAGDAVRGTIQCWGGSMVVVKSHAGRLDSRLLLCLTPTESGVTVTPIVARPRHGAALVDTLALRVTGWFFNAFLRRDIEPLRGMDLRLEGALATPGPLGWAARWFVTLPAFSPADDRCQSNVQTSTSVPVDQRSTAREVEV